MSRCYLAQVMGQGFTFRRLRHPAFFGALGAVALSAACATDPVYLGATTEGEVIGSDLPPYECNLKGDLKCFIDESLSEEQVRAVFDRGEDTPVGVLPPPQWHYPLPDSIHPSNLGLLTFHFEYDDAGDDIYELIIGEGSRAQRYYFPCLSAGGNGCLFKAPESYWTRVASVHAGEQVTLTLRAGNESGVSDSASLNIELSPSEVSGGLYYWSSQLKGMYRLTFGGREAVPYVAPETTANPKACAGCHAVSRDGSTIAYTQGDADPEASVFENAAFKGSLKVARVTALDAPLIDPDASSPSDSGMMSLSGNGSRIASAYDFKLELRDTQSGLVLDETLEIEGKTPFFPEFSPDNQFLAVTLSDDPDSEIAVRQGSIAVISVAGDKFGGATILIPEDPDLVHYYPSWSPDGRYIAFVTGPRGPGYSSYDQSQSRLRLVSVSTGEVFDLTNATGPEDATSTWPKFAPFSQCPTGADFCPDGEKIFFLSYSSKRAYGLVANVPGSVMRSQLWMSAIDVRRAQTGEDPSSPPFWVPYQAHDVGNHLGYWTEALRCNDDYGCGSGSRCDAQQGKCFVVVR